MSAGAPIGNQNGAKGFRWREAIERAIEYWPEVCPTGQNDKMKGINLAAHTFVKKMMDDHDFNFFKEFGDRLDGKPKQQTEITGADGSPILNGITVKMVKPS